MARLFISYKRPEGTEFAERLKSEVRPHEAWLDRAEIFGGSAWLDEIEEAIDSCDVFLAVLTPAYRTSDVVKTELARAYVENKRRVPLLVHPDAKELPFALTGIQWIDFTDPGAWETSLRALLEVIDRPPVEGRAEADWPAVFARVAKQAQRFVREHEGSAKNPGTYRAELYVRREAPERELERFLGGEASALLMIGASGVGKTNLLCRWTLDLLDQGHSVLAYDCSALGDTDIERELARDLSVRPDDLDASLNQIDAEAASAAKKFVIIFESVGDYRGSEKNGTPELLRNINALIRRVGEHVRVVLTCNAAAWHRMQRQEEIRLNRRRFYYSADDEPFLRLGLFTPEELDSAYRRYRDYFKLYSDIDDLAPAVRERLREPVLLRITAETFRGIKQPLFPANLASSVYRRFFDERVKPPDELLLVEELAEQMMRRRTSALSLMDLARDDHLGPKILDEGDSIYLRLLERGVLQEVSGDPRLGVVVKFAHTRVAAYALAQYLWRQSQNVTETAATFVAHGADFALAWEAAKMLLLVSRDNAAFTSLAASKDIEQRELAAEALVELYADDAKLARELLQSLLDQKSEEARRTALKAAYKIGPQARNFFVRAAIEGEPPLRESVKNTLYLIWRNEAAAGGRSVTETLYLIWRHAPDFTYELLKTLTGELRMRNLHRFPAITEFVLDLMITIYINHCEEEEVIQKTAALLHDLAINRLHLNLFNTGVLGPGFEKLVFGAVARVFGEQILNWMLFADDMPVQNFFALPREDRDRLGRIADVFDPESNLQPAHDDLAHMLRSGTPIFSGSAAMAIAVHATHDFRTTEPLIRQLWKEVGDVGRLWTLIGFSVLLKSTPAEWTGLLEDLTRSYIDEHRSSFLDESSRLVGGLDIVLLPLGLAYGKRGTSMALFQTLLQEAMMRGDMRLVARLTKALGVVGFYYPHEMFDVIRPLMEKLEDGQIDKALVMNLATVRTLHFDAVDQFLNRAGAPDALRHRIDVAADVELVRRYIRVVGYYNNAVHFTLYYPRMRKPLSAGALRLLAEARDGPQFVAEYTMRAMRMLRESRFQVLQWTLPE